ncbi:hypothetical protein P7K49_003773, partial [Saguinus oedipus]
HILKPAGEAMSEEGKQRHRPWPPFLHRPNYSLPLGSDRITQLATVPHHLLCCSALHGHLFEGIPLPPAKDLSAA